MIEREKNEKPSRPTDFNLIAEEYDAYGNRPSTTSLLGFNNALPLFGKLEGLRVLDYGCGAGRFSRLLKDSGAEVIGVDMAEKELEIAKAKYPDIEFRSISHGIQELKGNFDAVALNFVTCTMPSETAIREVFGNIQSLLRDGGRLIMLNPNFERGPGREFMTESWGQYEMSDGAPVSVTLPGKDGTFIIQDYFHSREFYTRVLTQTGFQIEAVSEPRATDTEHPWKDEINYSPILIISAIAKKQVQLPT